MKKLIMIAAMLALVLALAVPALAQVGQGLGQEIDESGDFAAEFSVSQTGDNSNQCAPALQFGNTGNVQNSQGFLQYASTSDDVEFEGSGFEFSPEQAVSCDQAVQQSAAASSW
jgi:hypothetical protein